MTGERPPRRDAAAHAPRLPAGWEREVTDRFRMSLSTNRMNTLSTSRTSSLRSNNAHLPSRHGSGPGEYTDMGDRFSLGALPSSTPIRNLPLIPAQPTTDRARKFQSQLHMLAQTPLKWENPGLLDEAMKQVPLDRIYREADEESQVFKATAESIGKKPAWAWQDCVIRAMLKWFRNTFFTWVNNPPCSCCSSPTIAVGMAAPTPEERALGGNRVELYQCSSQSCGAYERFPRYNDAFVLMQTRRGRCGEWVNCFSMLCRALGSRVRWVWHSEDYVSTEVYSDYRKRWVHVDPCEASFDKPLLYTEGWNRHVGYCIAFSSDGCMDVTRRYCRNPAKYAQDRTKCTEENLLFILDEVRAARRRDMNKDEKFKLEGEDARETRELRHYYVSFLTAEVAKLVVPGSGKPKSASQLADEQKQLERQQEAQARQDTMNGRAPERYNHHRDRQDGS